jgi:hypothetical protein
MRTKNITIIPEEGLVIVDGKGFSGLDMSSLIENKRIHAIQWYGDQDYGEVEYKPVHVSGVGLRKPGNLVVASTRLFDGVISEWKAAKEATENKEVEDVSV